jgi:hypothetical protein
MECALEGNHDEKSANMESQVMEKSVNTGSRVMKNSANTENRVIQDSGSRKLEEGKGAAPSKRQLHGGAQGVLPRHKSADCK